MIVRLPGCLHTGSTEAQFIGLARTEQVSRSAARAAVNSPAARERTVAPQIRARHDAQRAAIESKHRQGTDPIALHGLCRVGQTQPRPNEERGGSHGVDDAGIGPCALHVASAEHAAEYPAAVNDDHVVNALAPCARGDHAHHLVGSRRQQAGRHHLPDVQGAEEITRMRIPT